TYKVICHILVTIINLKILCSRMCGHKAIYMIRRIILITILLYVAVGIWFNATYNWPPPVDPVTFKTYKVNVNSIPVDELQSWEKEARLVEGVTALSLNQKSEILAVSVKDNHKLDQFIEKSMALNSNININAMQLKS